MRQLLIFVLLLAAIAASAQRRDPSRKSFGITLSYPFVNNLVFYEYAFGRTGSKTGFAGVTGSIFYKNQEEKISLSAGLITAIPVPFGAYDPSYENYTGILLSYIEGTFHKRVLPRLNLIAGLNYMEYAYTYWHDRTNSSSATDITGGLTTGAEYLFGRKNFSLALFYRPSLINFDGEKSNYRHAISLDVRIDINIIRFYN